MLEQQASLEVTGGGALWAPTSRRFLLFSSQAGFR